MAAIMISGFGGMQPATDDHLLPDNIASDAENTWMYDGKISGMRPPLLLHTLTNPAARSVFRVPKSDTGIANLADAYWIESQSVNASIVKGSVNNATDPRYYYTDTVNPPRYNTFSRIAAGSPDFVLGIPAPTVAPTLTSATGGVSGLTETRAYVYTHVSAYGEESPPSPAMIVATHKPDDTWTIALTAVGSVATDRNLTKTRIYRTITSDQGVADYYFVAEIAIATLTYADAALSSVISLNGNLTSQLYDPPPLLEGFVNFPNGMMIGWLGNQIWFCEPFLPHAWPATYQLSTEFKVVGIGVYGQTAVVCTQGTPYSLTGVTPSGMVLSKLVGLNEPCISRGSIASAPRGIYYAGPSGIVLVGPGGADIISDKLVAKDRWQSLLNVARLNATMLGRAYVTFSGIGENVFEPTALETTVFEQADYTGSRNGALIDLQDERIGFNKLVYTDPVFNVIRDVWTNEVLMVIGTGVYQLDVTTKAPQGSYVWRSKIYQTGKLVNFSCAKVYYDQPQLVSAGSVMPNGVGASTFKVYGDGNLVFTKVLPASGKMFRFPAGKRYSFYQFEVSGNLLIDNIQIATTPKELKQLGGR